MNKTTLDVWIVDDEPAMCQGVLRTIEDLSIAFDDLGESVSFQGSAMESGEAFLARLQREEAPDLLLLDGKLIHDLLDLTALESGQRRREMKHEDLSEIARSVAETHRDFAAGKQISIAVTGDEPCPIECDRSEIEMLLDNLLTNAIKYNVQGGRVAVNILSAPGRVIISVSDTGIGIADDDHEKLFCEFSRIKNSQTRSVDGSGLGLSIVKKIADSYGAEVTMKSLVGHGSTFTVAIPDTGWKIEGR